MSNFLSSGAGWLAQQLNQHTTQPIIYSRGSTVLELNATKGKSTFELGMSDGSVMSMEPVDWILSSDSLCQFELHFRYPADGDRIHDGQRNYEVLSPGGEKPHRYADPHRSVLRIHSKEVA